MPGSPHWRLASNPKYEYINPGLVQDGLCGGFAPHESFTLHGNKPPYGYRVEDKMLLIHEPEARVIRIIFTWYIYGDENGKRLSIKAITRRLTEMKVPTYTDIRPNATFKKKRGYGEWDKSTVSQILRSEVYKGTWRYGRVNSRTGEANPREHCIEVSVPAIVSEEIWQRAQERLEENKRLLTRKPKYKYLIGRRVSCGHCGTAMAGTMISRKYLYYFCPAKRDGRVATDCDNRYFRVDQVDATVWGWLKELLLNPEALRQNLEEQQAEQEEANKPLHDRLAVIDDLLVDNRRKLEKLLDLYLLGDFDKEMLTERKARLEMTITALEKEQGDLVAALEATILSDDQIMTIEDFARKVAGGLAKAETDFEARRQIIDLLDVRVTLAIEEGQKVAHVRCLVEGAELPVASTTH
jgi:site-specific DNA recombinase